MNIPASKRRRGATSIGESTKRRQPRLCASCGIAPQAEARFAAASSLVNGPRRRILR
jgi:hypothetical protein